MKKVGGNGRIHLNSVSAMSDVNGNLVPDSTARYTPFGGWRTEPGTNPTITDQGYTGHAHNPYIKLIYMNARWYDGTIGRFISPDTIVPDPTNPQSFNRYSYTYNNPVKYIDPTGHYATTDDSSTCPTTKGCKDIFSQIPTAPTKPPFKDDLDWTAWQTGDFYDKNLIEQYDRERRSYDAFFELKENHYNLISEYKNWRPGLLPPFLAKLTNATDTALDLIELFGGKELLPGAWLPAVNQIFDDSTNPGLYPEERLLRASVATTEGYLVDSLSIALAQEFGGMVAIATWEMSPIVMVPATIGTMGGTYFGVQAAGDHLFEWANDRYAYPRIRSFSEWIR